MCGKVQVNFKMLRYGTDIGTIETKQKKMKEKQNRRKDSDRSKCCISCALRGGVQRGPIKGLDAAAQMRYTHTKGRWYFDCKWFPPVSSSLIFAHHTKLGKIDKVSSRVAGEPHASISTRIGSPVFECSSCSKSSVFRDSVRGCGSSNICKSQSLRRTSARLLVDTVLTRRLGIYKIFTRRKFKK